MAGNLASDEIQPTGSTGAGRHSPPEGSPMTEPSTPRPGPGPPRPGQQPGEPAPAPGAAAEPVSSAAPLADLVERPIAEHVAVFETEHVRLERELGTIDQL